ncbi:MAG: DUF3617 domain-containing protein [Novosphingobium sp.]|nr:DUF3617 domain-containing protein [Novosphingobium sp.]
MTTPFRLATLSMISAGAIALAGCGSNESVEAENESAESVAEKVANAEIKPKPGMWESTMTVEKLEIPNMPPEAKEMMQAALGKGQTFKSCLTPEEAAKPNAEFFQGKNSGCTYEKFNMAGGTIDAVMTCSEGGQTQNMTMAGKYSEESYDIKVTADGEAQPGMPMSMAMSIASKRIGECTGKEEG